MIGGRWAGTSSTARSVPLDPDRSVWVLGREFAPSTSSAASDSSPRDDGAVGIDHRFGVLSLHMYSLIHFTYRKKFEPLKSRPPLTTDLGWGCMLRSGQMLLAQAFTMHHLGKDFLIRPADPPERFDTNNPDITQQDAMYIEILRWFYDSSSSPFSIHRIASLGCSYGKAIGEWFGPSTISHVLRDLVENYRPSGMKILVSLDGCIYRSDKMVSSLWDSRKPDHGTCKHDDDDDGDDEVPAHDDENAVGMVVLIPLRLGIRSFNMVYAPCLKAFLEMPYTVGIMGGRPRSSYYFIGYQGDDILYLDPHSLQLVSTDHLTYHARNASMMKFSDIDPSMAIGFYCGNHEEFVDLCDRIETLNEEMEAVPISVMERCPEYADLHDVGSVRVGTNERHIDDDDDDDDNEDDNDDDDELEEFVLLGMAEDNGVDDGVAMMKEFEEDAALI